MTEVVGEVYMYTHHVYMYMYLALTAMSYLYRYSMCAIRDQSTDRIVHAQIIKLESTWSPWNREGNYSKHSSLSLPHFITSPAVFSHNLTLLLSPSQPHSTTSFLPNTGGYILKQWQVQICTITYVYISIMQ